MWIVRLALRRPFTFVVMATLIAILGVTSILVMPVDIFPYIDIPVVSVVWSYPGVSPEDMEKRIVTVSERAMTTTVNDIEHIESQSYNGVAVIKLFFQPNVKVELAIAQVTAIMQTILRALPPGIFPPNILKYDASSVPILQIGLGSDTLTESQLYDYGQNFVRTQLATIQGASLPLPYGGKTRQIMVDINPDALYAKQLSATDVSNALSLQNLILPAGTAKIGRREYLVRVNSSPLYVETPERPTHKDRKRRHRLHQRCGSGARRRGGSDEYRAPGRRSRGAPDSTQERQSFNAFNHQPREEGSSRHSGESSARIENEVPVRSVAVRARLDQRGIARGGDRRRADRADDPVVSGEYSAAQSSCASRFPFRFLRRSLSWRSPEIRSTS